MDSAAPTLDSARVLVTGCSGFLGVALTRLLLGRGAEVHGISRSPASESSAITKLWQGRLTDIAFLRRVLGEVRPDFLFHLAGAVTGVRELGAVIPTFEGNLTSTVNILTAAAEQPSPPRVVMAGSLEEPDDAGEPPSSPYAASKLAAYQYARMFQSLYGLSVVVPRVFIVYGPGQADPKKLIPYVVTSLLRGESPKLSSGNREIDWIYVDDAAEGLLATALARDVTERVDLGSGQLLTTRDLIERLAALVPSTGKPLLGALPDRPMEQVRVADVEKTSRLIGWKPGISLDAGLRRTVEWLKSQSA